MSIRQISVFLENRTGQLAEITSILARGNVNLRAISIAETADYGIVRMIADDMAAAAAVLREAGMVISTGCVQVIAVPDKPGGLALVLEPLAEHNITVEYMYSLFNHSDGVAYMVIRVSEEEKFAALMGSCGIEVVTAEKLGVR